jgi:Tol biopolymer transport system component
MRTRSAAVRTYRFDPQAARVLGGPTTVIESGSGLTQPEVSPDGRYLAYRTVRPREVITTLDLETGERRRLTDDGFRNRGPSWSSDGRWIAMYSNRSGRYQIWRMRPEGTDLHLICEASTSDPVCSPDGDRIATTVDFGDRGFSTAIWAPDPDATDPLAPWIEVRERIPEFSVTGWSPNGRFLSGSTGWPWVLRIYDLEAETFVERDPVVIGTQYEPMWLPDNERLLFWSDEDQRFVTWSPRTGAMEPVAGLDSPPGTPRLSPDGRTLYVLEDNVDGEIWMLTLQGAGNGDGGGGEDG